VIRIKHWVWLIEVVIQAEDRILLLDFCSSMGAPVGISANSEHYIAYGRCMYVGPSLGIVWFGYQCGVLLVAQCACFVLFGLGVHVCLWAFMPCLHIYKHINHPIAWLVKAVLPRKMVFLCHLGPMVCHHGVYYGSPVLAQGG